MVFETTVRSGLVPHKTMQSNRSNKKNDIALVQYINGMDTWSILNLYMMLNTVSLVRGLGNALVWPTV